MKGNTTHKAGDRLITRIEKIHEVNNDKCHNFYFEAHFKLYDTDRHYWKGNFVVWFDTEDLAEEYPNKTYYNDKDIREYAKAIAIAFVESAPKLKPAARETNLAKLEPFYAECRETVERYNKVVCGWELSA